MGAFVMKQIDFISSDGADSAAFRDIRATRPSVAEEKAQLSLILHRLCARAPST